MQIIHILNKFFIGIIDFGIISMTLIIGMLWVLSSAIILAMSIIINILSFMLITPLRSIDRFIELIYNKLTNAVRKIFNITD